MSFCPWCGKENADTDALCENCGGQLTASPVQPAQPIQPTQPQPQAPIQNPFGAMPKVNTEALGGFAKAAGSAFADLPKKAAHAPRPNIQTGGYGFQYIVSFLFPIFGFIFGAIMMAADAPEKIKVGKTCVLLAIAFMLLSVIVSTIIVMLNY